MKRVKAIIGSLFTITVVWIIAHNINRHFESRRLDGKYEYVTIDGKKLHCWKKGDGKHTIILLSGYGTPSPILDFQPFARELGNYYKVIIIENFGYGYSDDTDKPRTFRNLDSELHNALSELKIMPPFILVAHSISGIFAYFLAAEHSSEVEAIIGIDPAVPLFFAGNSISGNSWKEHLLQICGVVRLASIFIPELITPNEMNMLYDKEILAQIRLLAVRNYHNEAQKDEFHRYDENGKLTLSLGRNPYLPVLYFLSDNGKPETKWKKLRIEDVKKHKTGIVVSLEGSHYLHRTNPKEMAGKIKTFIDKNVQ